MNLKSMWNGPSSESSSHWRGPGSNLIGRSASLGIGLLSQAHDSVSSIQGRSDLLVSLHEPLQLDVEILVLALENGTVLVDGVALGLHIVVSLQEILVVESKVFLLLLGDRQLIFGVTEFSLSFKYLRVKISISRVFGLCLSLQVRFVSQLAVKVSLEGLSLSHES